MKLTEIEILIDLLPSRDLATVHSMLLIAYNRLVEERDERVKGRGSVRLTGQALESWLDFAATSIREHGNLLDRIGNERAKRQGAYHE